MLERAETSRRLKAARWLAGEVDAKGAPRPLSPQELAAREPLRRNGISANAVMEIEQLRKDARPMELREISAALDLPDTWFDEHAPPWAAREVVVTGPQLAAIVELLHEQVASGAIPSLDEARVSIQDAAEDEFEVLRPHLELMRHQAEIGCVNKQNHVDYLTNELANAVESQRAGLYDRLQAALKDLEQSRRELAELTSALVRGDMDSPYVAVARAEARHEEHERRAAGGA